ncbi:hypothetical protein RchiOBHm_Chr1g0320511 [Rosa chinensis]|uniref:Uncharacterized protein n=1 Tax=Rosa chinensis TaxID=74649 RepID=A0A2P6S8T5_ROSCH|nr:hypothetical protein RchiOBHm_Chr1g0320511 [Rosa chinensis]
MKMITLPKSYLSITKFWNGVETACQFLLLMKISFFIKLGTVDQNEAQNEWVLKQYMNTASKKQNFIGN